MAVPGHAVRTVPLSARLSNLSPALTPRLRMQAKQNVEVLKQTEVIRNVQNILQVGTGGQCWPASSCGAVGRGCIGRHQRREKLPA